MRKKKKVLFIFVSIMVCLIAIFAVVFSTSEKGSESKAFAFVESNEINLSYDSDNTGAYIVYGLDEDYDYFYFVCATSKRAEEKKNEIQMQPTLDTTFWTRISDCTIDFNGQGAVIVVKVIPTSKEIKNYKIFINPLAHTGNHVTVCMTKRSSDFKDGFAINDFGDVKQNRYELETNYQVSVDSGYGFFVQVFGEDLLYFEKNGLGITQGNSSESPILYSTKEFTPGLVANLAKGKHYVEAKIYSVKLDENNQGIAGTETIEFTVVLKVNIEKGESSIIPTVSTGDGKGDGTVMQSLSKGEVCGIVVASIFGMFILLYIFGYVFLYRKGKLEGRKLCAIYSFLPKQN